MTLNTKQVKKDNKKAVPREKGAALIYVGPTSKHITRYTVYKNGYPLHLKEQMKECKVFKNLFIPLDKLTEFEKNVTQKGTVESIWFQEAQKYFKAVKQ